MTDLKKCSCYGGPVRAVKFDYSSIKMKFSNLPIFPQLLYVFGKEINLNQWKSSLTLS